MTPPAAPAPATASPALRPLIDAALPDIVAIRHDLHRHPELAYQERRTSGVIARELARLSVAHKAGLAGGTGVVAHIPATTPTPGGCVGLRADIDALPIEEKTGLPYASEHRGLMHACGHDGHTANLLGVARVLSQTPHRPRPVTLVFQPAEEGGAGGRRMCEDGVLDGEAALGNGLGPPVTEMYGLHGWPQLPAGHVASKAGPLLAATDGFTITVRGRQAHAAYPHLGHDPIVATAGLITALQTIASRTVSPLDSVVVTVGMVQAGVARNVIPETARLVGTVRTLRAQTRAAVKERFYALVNATAAAYGCAAAIEWETGYPVTDNHPEATERFFRVARARLGADRVSVAPEPTMGGEDFAFYGQKVPACFFLVGVCPPERTGQYPTLHQPEFDFNDAALPAAMELMCSLALES